jgi:cathepsin L
MKALSTVARLFAVIVSSASASRAPELPHWSEPDEDFLASLPSFEQFARAFRKTYEDAAERDRRRSVYERNLRAIAAHNSRLRLLAGERGGGGGGHALRVNEFADLTSDELPTGRSKAPGAEKLTAPDGPLTVPLDTPVSLLPKSVDWRSRGVTTAVKHQGRCGSCWAFASTAALESHLALQTGKLFSLSVQQVVSCSDNPRHCGGGGGCAGATAQVAYEHVRRRGAVEEWAFGYQSYAGATVNCTLLAEPLAGEGPGSPLRRGGISPPSASKLPYAKDAVAAIVGYANLEPNNYLALMNAVAKLGPVAVSVACSTWQFYSSGVFSVAFNESVKQTTDVNHLVVLEGYGTDAESGEDYWLIRNSWGT